MQTLHTFLNTLPNWVLPIGWLALLLGWGLGRPATARLLLKNGVNVKGNGNTLYNNVSQKNISPTSSGVDSSLSKASSYATVAGLVLTLLPMLKDWFK
jgi:hypothetical protein